MYGCQGRPEFNGIWVLTNDYVGLLDHLRPTYTKTDDDLYVYYWMDTDGDESGWYIASEVGHDQFLGFHPDTTSMIVPSAGWQIVKLDTIDCVDDPATFSEPPGIADGDDNSVTFLQAFVCVCAFAYASRM